MIKKFKNANSLKIFIFDIKIYEIKSADGSNIAETCLFAEVI